MNSLSPSTLAAVAGVTALVGAFKGLTSSLGAVIDNYAHFEKLQMGLTTFFQDADKGKAKFEELRKLSNETTFGVDELTDSFTQLANVGVKVDSITGKLTMLGDLAQGDKTKFAELTSIYAKINSVGKAGSMQLQQIASRGIPIYDVLKKIGVQGTATAEDITMAFEEMTKEGCQFYNAMNNINETIEGKEGFISDYFKEFTVNFAEVTGLADSYKDTLDVLKNVIGSVSDRLLEWNSNPVIKAIITGAFSSMLVGIVAVIGVSLVGALNTVIVKLGIIEALKAAITGPAGLITLGVAGVTALVMGIKSYSNSLEQAEKDQDALNKKIKEQLDLAHQGDNPVSNSRDNQLAQAKKDLETYSNAKGKATAELQKAKKALQEYDKMVADFEKSWSADSGMTKEEWVKDNLWAMSLSNGTDNQTREDLSASVDRWSKSVEQANGFLDMTRDKIHKLNEEIENFGDTDELKKNFESIYETVSKAEKEQATLKEQLAKVHMYKDQNGKVNNAGQLIRFDDQTKIAIDDTIRYLENKLKGVNAWEDVFKSVTGIAVPKAGTANKSRGQLAGEAYTERMEKLFEAQVKAKVAIGGDEKKIRQEVASEFVKNIGNQIESLISNIDVDQPFEETDSTIKALNDSLLKYKDMIDEVAEKSLPNFSKVIEDLKSSSSVGSQTAGYALSSLSSASGDVSAFAQGFAIGGPIGGIISTLLNAIMTAVSDMEDFQKVMNPITEAIKKLSPILEVMIDDLAWATDVFTALFDVIALVLNILKPIVQVISAFTKVLSVPIRLLGILAQVLSKLIESSKIMQGFTKWFGDMFGWLDNLEESEKAVNDEKQRELEILKRMREAYDSLYTAMKEQEEYYLRKKTQLNADTYKEGAVRKVNDMILTDKGVFSTSPKDTIMAMKNPESLMGGTSVNVQVIDNVGVNGNIRQEGNNIYIELISQKIADDYANGRNGWNVAVESQQSSSMGRSISL